MYDGTEGHSISPGGGQVCDLDPFVITGDLFTPI